MNQTAILLACANFRTGQPLPALVQLINEIQNTHSNSSPPVYLYRWLGYIRLNCLTGEKSWAARDTYLLRAQNLAITIISTIIRALTRHRQNKRFVKLSIILKRVKHMNRTIAPL